MSYEEYEQYLCKNGHYFTEEVYLYSGKEKICPTCKEKIAWHNSVDETNCDGFGYIPMALLLTKEAVHKTCDMGHSHLVEEAVYRIPNEEETKSLRTWREANGTLRTIETNIKVGKGAYDPKKCSQCGMVKPSVKTRDFGFGLKLGACDDCIV